jgi:uncharacterized protein YkwD
LRLFILGFLAHVLALTPIAAVAQELPARFDAPIAPGGPDPALFQEAVLILVNVERRRGGRAALAGDPRLARAAAAHAANMARHRAMAHRLPDAKAGKLAQRLAGEGVTFRRAGENIGMEKAYRLLGRPIAARASGCAFTYADTGAPVPPHSHASLAGSAVARWMASPGHRANILEGRFKRMGAGAAIDPQGAACGDVYLAQTFAG